MKSAFDFASQRWIDLKLIWLVFDAFGVKIQLKIYRLKNDFFTGGNAWIDDWWTLNGNEKLYLMTLDWIDADKSSF